MIMREILNKPKVSDYFNNDNDYNNSPEKKLDKYIKDLIRYEQNL